MIIFQFYIPPSREQADRSHPGMCSPERVVDAVCTHTAHFQTHGQKNLIMLAVKPGLLSCCCACRPGVLRCEIHIRATWKGGGIEREALLRGGVCLSQHSRGSIGAGLSTQEGGGASFARVRQLRALGAPRARIFATLSFFIKSHLKPSTCCSSAFLRE